MLGTTIEHLLANPAARAAFRAPTRPLKLVCAAVSCGNCCLKGVCLPCGLSQDDMAAFDELAMSKRRVTRGASLYRSGDRFDALHAVRSGAFKSVSVSRNGDVKVTGLHLQGEIMGLDAIDSGSYNYNSVALEDSEVCVIPYSRLARLAQRLPELQTRLLRVLSSDISRDHGLLLLLGGMAAEQRIAAFLLSLSRRYERLGYAETRFNLRMTREDIGSYLGLTLETVSRLMSRFQRDGLIATHQREIELKDMDGLAEIVGHW